MEKTYKEKQQNALDDQRTHYEFEVRKLEKHVRDAKVAMAGERSKSNQEKVELKSAIADAQHKVRESEINNEKLRTEIVRNSEASKETQRKHQEELEQLRDKLSQAQQSNSDASINAQAMHADIVAEVERAKQATAAVEEELAAACKEVQQLKSRATGNNELETRINELKRELDNALEDHRQVELAAEQAETLAADTLAEERKKAAAELEAVQSELEKTREELSQAKQDMKVLANDAAINQAAEAEATEVSASATDTEAASNALGSDLVATLEHALLTMRDALKGDRSPEALEKLEADLHRKQKQVSRVAKPKDRKKLSAEIATDEARYQELVEEQKAAEDVFVRGATAIANFVSSVQTEDTAHMVTLLERGMGSKLDTVHTTLDLMCRQLDEQGLDQLPTEDLRAMAEAVLRFQQIVIQNESVDPSVRAAWQQASPASPGHATQPTIEETTAVETTAVETTVVETATASIAPAPADETPKHSAVHADPWETAMAYVREVRDIMLPLGGPDAEKGKAKVRLLREECSFVSESCATPPPVEAQAVELPPQPQEVKSSVSAFGNANVSNEWELDKEELEATLEKERRQVDQLQKQKTQLEKTCTAQEEQLMERALVEAQQEAHILEATETVKQLKLDLKQLTADMEMAQEENLSLENEVNALQAQVQAAEQECAHLHAKLEALEEQRVTEIAALEAERDAQLLAKDEELTALAAIKDAQLDEKVLELEHAGEELARRMDHIHELDEALAEAREELRVSERRRNEGQSRKMQLLKEKRGIGRPDHKPSYPGVSQGGPKSSSGWDRAGNALNETKNETADMKFIRELQAKKKAREQQAAREERARAQSAMEGSSHRHGAAEAMEAIPEEGTRAHTAMGAVIEDDGEHRAHTAADGSHTYPVAGARGLASMSRAVGKLGAIRRGFTRNPAGLGKAGEETGLAREVGYSGHSEADNAGGWQKSRGSTATSGHLDASLDALPNLAEDPTRAGGGGMRAMMGVAKMMSRVKDKRQRGAVLSASITPGDGGKQQSSVVIERDYVNVTPSLERGVEIESAAKKKKQAKLGSWGGDADLPNDGLPGSSAGRWRGSMKAARSIKNMKTAVAAMAPAGPPEHRLPPVSQNPRGPTPGTPIGWSQDPFDLPAAGVVEDMFAGTSLEGLEMAPGLGTI